MKPTAAVFVGGLWGYLIPEASSPPLEAENWEDALLLHRQQELERAQCES